MMVAMNPQTWDADIAEIEPGGYLFYDSTRPMPPDKFRDDVHTIGVPLTEIANDAYSDPRQRQLFKNIIYVGVLSVLLDADPAVFKTLFAEQYKGKERLLDANNQALQLGRDYAQRYLKAPLGIRLQRADAVGDSSDAGCCIFMRFKTCIYIYNINDFTIHQQKIKKNSKCIST